MTKKTALTGSNSLADLAARINTEHEAAEVAYQDAVAHAMTCGDLLIEAKSELKHGGWSKWLKQNCEVSARTATLYMRLAKNREWLASPKAREWLESQNGNGVADLSLRGADMLIRHRRGGEETLARRAANAAAEKAAIEAGIASGDIVRTELPGGGYSLRTRNALSMPPLVVVEHKPPTPEEIADAFIEELARSYYEGGQDLIGIEDLRAAFERRWPSPDEEDLAA
jgi:hypothetical protein